MSLRRFLGQVKWGWKTHPKCGLGAQSTQKGENKASTSIHLSLLPDCGCSVSHYLTFLLSRLCHQEGLWPPTVRQINLPCLKFLVTCSVTPTRKLTSTTRCGGGWALLGTEDGDDILAPGPCPSSPHNGEVPTSQSVWEILQETSVYNQTSKYLNPISCSLD